MLCITGIVDEDVNGAEVLHGSLYTSSGEVFCSYIASKGDGLTALRLNLIRYLPDTDKAFRVSIYGALLSYWLSTAACMRILLTCFALEPSRSVTTSLAPCWAKSFAAAAPRPWPEPVMMATCRAHSWFCRHVYLRA